MIGDKSDPKVDQLLALRLVTDFRSLITFPVLSIHVGQRLIAPCNQSVAVRRGAISQKVLDSLGGPTLYKNARAITRTSRRDGEDQMFTSLFNKPHTARRPSGITMPCVVVCGSLGSSWVYNPGGNLGQEATNFIDSRRIRH